MIASHIVTELVILWLKRHNCNSNFNFVSAFEKKNTNNTHTHQQEKRKERSFELFFNFYVKLVLFYNRINEFIVSTSDIQCTSWPGYSRFCP